MASTFLGRQVDTFAVFFPRPLIVILGLTHGLWAGGVYWTDRRADRLYHMQFDGSDQVEVVQTGTGSNTRGLSLDLANGRLYWADNATDRIWRAKLDGTGSSLITMISGSSFPADVHFARGAGALYWCDRNRGHIDRSNLDGSAISVAISEAAPSGPYFMDLEERSEKIYWGDFSGGSIYRSNLDGSDREVLVTGNNSTRGVRVDPVGGMLYWINRNDKKVHRAPLAAMEDGPIPITDSQVETIYDGLDTPHGLTIDVPARKVYWADTGTNSGLGIGGQAISRGDLDGGTPAEVIATGEQPWDVEVDLRCETYDEWRRRCFRKDAQEAQTDPLADPDGDGFPNLLEYCLDRAPLDREGVGLPQVLLVNGAIPGVRYAALRFRRRSGTSDLSCYVQQSADLEIWEGTAAAPVTSEIQVSSLGNGIEEVLVRANTPVAAGGARYLRIVAQLGGS